MKTLLTMLIVFVLSITLSCKKSIHKGATVVIDCSGTYLKIAGKNYQVCNSESLSSFENGNNVTVNYKSIESCASLLPITAICNLNYPNEGWIEVLKVN